VVSERLQKAKEQINTGNWHYVRHSEDVELLVEMVIDFIKNIKSGSIFPNEFNI
jgi:hypothetical protein